MYDPSDDAKYFCKIFVLSLDPHIDVRESARKTKIKANGSGSGQTEKSERSNHDLQKSSVDKPDLCCIVNYMSN